MDISDWSGLWIANLFLALRRGFPGSVRSPPRIGRNCLISMFQHFSPFLCSDSMWWADSASAAGHVHFHSWRSVLSFPNRFSPQLLLSHISSPSSKISNSYHVSQTCQDESCPSQNQGISSHQFRLSSPTPNTPRREQEIWWPYSQSSRSSPGLLYTSAIYDPPLSQSMPKTSWLQ